MPDSGDDRASLVNRMLPEMTLSDQSAASLTKPLPPLSQGHLQPHQRATLRFAIEGCAVITGGTGTLALECGKALLEHGLSGLALLDINAAPGFSALQEEFSDRKIVVHQCDVTSAPDLERVMKTVEQELGSVDILCCFAGVVGCAPSLSMTPEVWRRTLDINTTGAFLSAQAAGRVMRERGNGGSIVFIASMSAHRVNFPQPQAAYNASKAALLHLSHSLAAEWAVYGIRVNTISPGYMDTILNEGAGLERARRIWQERTPMGRMGAPQELTGPLVLMCSRFAGAYITGTDLVVDGGQTVF